MANSAVQLLAALSALYTHEDRNVKDEADRWLEAWQQTVEAWSVADAVLHDPSSAMEAQYFCAQTLRTKVQRDFEELPEQAVLSLRDSLLSLLLKYAKGPPPVRTQLCLALAALAMHLPAARWGEGGCVRWFAARFQSVGADLQAALPCMLELFMVLPQETGSHRIAIRPERRRAFIAELQASTPEALGILASCLHAPGETTKSRVMEAFGAWLKLSEGRVTESTAAALMSHLLVAVALEALKSNDTFHAAVDALIEVVWTTVDLPSMDLLPAMLPLVQVMVPAIMELRPRFAIAVQRASPGKGGSNAVAEDADDDDEDTAKDMSRLFCEVAEAYINLIITATPEVQAPVEAMLEVASHPDFSICSASFNFWGRLAAKLDCDLRPTANTGATALSSDAAAAEQRRRIAYFRPAFERLVTLIRGRVREPEGFADWGKDERSEFRTVRYEIAGVLQEAASVVQFKRALQLLAEPLAHCGTGETLDWRTAEAALYCIKAISSLASDPGDADLVNLLEALPGLPKQAQLQYTVCSVIGKYADWVRRTAETGRFDGLLQRLLTLAVSDLELPQAQAAAGQCIRDLCETSGHLMGSLTQSLLQLYQRCLQLGKLTAVTPLPGVERPQLMAEEDVDNIISAVVRATCKCLPPQQLPQALAALLQPLLASLQAAVASLPAEGVVREPHSSEPSSSSSHPHTTRLQPLIDRLSVVFSRVDQPALVADMLSESWPLLDALLGRCASDGDVVEHTLRALRYGLKSAGKNSARMLPTMLEVLPARFRATRHSAYLFIVSELVKIFGDEGAHDVAMAGILCALLSEATAGLRTFESLTASPDMVDDVYLLAQRALTYGPRLLLGSASTLEALLDTAMLGILLQHREANGSVLGFLGKVLDPAMPMRAPPPAAAHLSAALTPRAPSILRLLLAGVVGVSPSSRVVDLAATLRVLLLASKDAGLAWLNAALALLPEVAAPTDDKHAFLGAAAAMVRSGNPADPQDRSWEASTDEFAQLCRRNRRSRQAAELALLPPELVQPVLGGQ